MTWLPTVVAILALIWIAGTTGVIALNLLEWQWERTRRLPNQNAITAAARRTLTAWAWPITITRNAITAIRDLIDDAKH